MLKLFAVLLGGRADRCNVELHDVVFAVGHSIEETYPQLKSKWFGNNKRLHIDSVIELTTVDQHEVVISEKNEKSDSKKKLFFVNFGGYKENYFGELHEVAFYVAESKPEVLAKAKSQLGLSLTEPHCDDNLIVDDIISISEVDQYQINLLPTSTSPALKIESFYRRLDA